MSGIRLWRCSRCCEQVAVVIDRTKLFCGECFYRQTVERVMAAAFAPERMERSQAGDRRSTIAGTR